MHLLLVLDQPDLVVAGPRVGRRVRNGDGDVLAHLWKRVDELAQPSLDAHLVGSRERGAEGVGPGRRQDGVGRATHLDRRSLQRRRGGRVAQDVLSTGGVDGDALAVEGQHVTGLHREVRHAIRGELTHRRIGEVGHSQLAGVEHHRVLPSGAGRPEHVGVEDVARGRERGSRSVGLVPALEGGQDAVGQRRRHDDEDRSQLTDSDGVVRGVGTVLQRVADEGHVPWGRRLGRQRAVGVVGVAEVVGGTVDERRRRGLDHEGVERTLLERTSRGGIPVLLRHPLFGLLLDLVCLLLVFVRVFRVRLGGDSLDGSARQRCGGPGWARGDGLARRGKRREGQSRHREEIQADADAATSAGSDQHDREQDGDQPDHEQRTEGFRIYSIHG